MIKILVTGGAGFIGSNLIKFLKKTKHNIEITSLDNYFTGSINNHVDCVEYINGHTKDADRILYNRRFNIVFHLGEYSRIVSSFKDINILRESILVGTPIILELCRKWNAKLIYSASSSKFGNNGKDENLSPYSWMKAKMVELIKNYNKWFNLQYEIAYFFNVYGPGQIMYGKYATVIGIFEKQWKNNEKCTVVSPGTQTRDFTNVFDIVSGLVKIMNKKDNHEWYLRSGINYDIISIAKMFGEYVIIPERRGERKTSITFENDTCERLNWKPTHHIENWIKSVKKTKLEKIIVN